MFLKGRVQLKKNNGFLKGSLWVFSNELEHIDTQIKPGSWVALENAQGESVAYGYFNPHSLIAFRVFERDPFQSEQATKAVFFERLNRAYKIRLKIYHEQIQKKEVSPFSFRLAFGESDFLPGLVVDLYEGIPSPVAVIQCHGAGADFLIDWTKEWLEKFLKISSGVIRNDLEIRKRENVPLFIKEWGLIPSEIYALEGGMRFFINVKEGQKTGYFYDHRENRSQLMKRVLSNQKMEVLDTFSYVGSWGLQVLKKNSKARLLAVDSSPLALEQLLKNALENGLSDRVETLKIDVFKKEVSIKKAFDIVIVDPPQLISSAKNIWAGKHAYMKCYKNGFEKLSMDGTVVFSSCSYHLSWVDFLDCVHQASRASNKSAQMTYVGTQAFDHPLLASMPEAQYLKCVFVEGSC